MRHLWLASVALALLAAPGCSASGPVLQAGATAAQPLELRWEDQGLRLRLELEGGEGTLRVEQRGSAAYVYWGSSGYLARFEGREGRVFAAQGSTLKNPMLEPEALPLRPIGSGSFRAGVSLRLHPDGEVSVLSSASKLDAVLAERWR